VMIVHYIIRQGLPCLLTVSLALSVSGCTTPFQLHYAAASQKTMCPGNTGETPYIPLAEPYKAGDVLWVPQTACEAAIVQMAVDRCIGAASTGSDISGAGSFSDGAGIALNAVGSALNGMVSSVVGIISNPLLTTTRLVATLGTSVAKAVSGAASNSLSIKDMYAAAGSYTLNNQKLAKDEAYYKGLWNAVGSICPPNPIDGFEMEKSNSGYSAPALVN